MQKTNVVICLINFIVAALMGLALRYSFLESVGVNYRFLTHAHSHVAMLGWVYLMLYVCIVHYFVPEKKPIYNRLFWFSVSRLWCYFYHIFNIAHFMQLLFCLFNMDTSQSKIESYNITFKGFTPIYAIINIRSLVLGSFSRVVG